MSIIRQASSFSLMTVISRVAGFVRDIAMANVLGVGWMADVFLVALRLPNLLRNILAEGAFSSAFVPVFKQVWQSEGKQAARSFAIQILTMVLAIGLAIVVLGEIGMSGLISAMLPGFSAESSALATSLARITFIFVVLILIVAWGSAILNTAGHFGLPAAMPIVTNVCMIAALIPFVWQGDSFKVCENFTACPAFSLAIAVVVAGVIEVIIILCRLRSIGFVAGLTRGPWSPRIHDVWRRFSCTVSASGVYQINVLFSTILASTLASGSISYLYYADRLAQLPLGLIGVALSTALLPALSAGQSKADFTAHLNQVVVWCLLLTVPAAIGLNLLATPIIEVLFVRGAFDGAAAEQTSKALVVFAIGVPALTLGKILTTVLFSTGDTKTPLYLSIGIVITNITLGYILMSYLAHAGLALALSVVAWGHVGVLMIICGHRNLWSLDWEQAKILIRIGLANGLLFAFLWGVEGRLPTSVGGLALTIGAGLVLYGAVCWALGMQHRLTLRSGAGSK